MSCLLLRKTFHFNKKIVSSFISLFQTLKEVEEKEGRVIITIFSEMSVLVFILISWNLILAKEGILQQKYKSLSQGQSLRGSAVEKITMNSLLQCAAR